jgi:hypothetical protein
LAFSRTIFAKVIDREISGRLRASSEVAIDA